MYDSDTEPAPVTPPDGCESTETHEREFTATAKYCEQLAQSVTNADDLGLVVKLMDAAIKARRAASQLARDREDDAEARRIERMRDGIGGGH